MGDRHVGVNVPLFSLRSERGWGLGELTDLAPFARPDDVVAVERAMGMNDTRA